MQLRVEIKEAIAKGEVEGLTFQGGLELELTMVATRTKGGSGKLKFVVVVASVEAGSELNIEAVSASN